MFETALFYLTAPLRRLFMAEDQFNLVTLMAALGFALLWYGLRRPRRFVARAKIFLAAAFARKYWMHASVGLDVKLFFVNSILMATGIFTQFVSGAKLAGAWQEGLAGAFGPSPFEMPANLPLALTMSVFYVIFVDLGYWIAHWLMHRYSGLWEFHKVHHSAEVLTPLTEWRQHPVELFLFPLCIMLVLGTFYGIAGYLFGEHAQPFSWLQLNVLMFVLMATTLHLRHSHLWLRTSGWLGYIIQSPAHHQIHHSEQAAHFDKNLGLVLSIWDWAFGTLYIPNEQEKLTFGIGAESHDHDSVLSAYWLPMLKVWRKMAPAVEPPAAAAAENINRV